MSLVAAILGWLRGENLPKSKTRPPSTPVLPVTSQGCVLQKFAKRRAQVEFRESRELWYTCMADAETFEEWVTAAQRLDEIEGHVEWKATDTSPSYDCKLLRERIRQVQHMVAHESMPDIVDWLRGGLQRNFVGSGNSELFDEFTHCGTKILIERHNCEMTRLLFEVANCREDAMSLEKRLAFFTEARHALGKSALLLSGGLGLGMYHLGVVRALHEQHLLPRVISASSFGAVVAVVVGTSTVDELSHMFESMFEPDDNICSHLHAAQQDRFDVKIRRLLSTGHMLDAEKLEQALKASLGDVSFHEAYERTGRIINITIPGTGEMGHDRPRFLNYLTAPNILLWSAACASCELSGGQNSGKIVAKDVKGHIFVYNLKPEPRGAGAADVEGGQSYQPWEDCSGEGVHADLPMNRLKELFNVNFFIVSQNTACAIPFVQRSQTHVRHDPLGPSRVSFVRRITSTLGYLLRSEVLHRCEQAITLGLAPKSLKKMLNQKYMGDVTIAPGPLEVCSKLLFKRDQVAQREFVRMGERRTWPRISQVRGQCEVEMVLDQCVRHLAAQIQRKAQRHANRCNTKVFTPHFRQQRHTHLDLNQFFSPNLALSSATPLATEARREDMRTSSSGSSIPLLLPLPPFSFRSTDDHHHLVPVEVRCPPNQPTYEGSVGATTKAPCPAITLPSSFLHPPFTLPKIGAITLPSPSLHPSFTLPSAKRAAVVTVTWPYLQ
mmetsp:Transcript_71757/g.116326  ORF Transcript_71757/g.116326 Transcript_71757/m.116326 type:complete len:723 (+) Transcript_71757:229-2397(+)